MTEMIMPKRAGGMSARLRVFWLLLVLILPAASRLAAQESSAAPGEAEAVTAPVRLDGLVLFRVRGASSFPAEDRASAIRGHLRAVAADQGIAVESFRTVDADGVTRILAGARPIMTVVDADALLEQLKRTELAQVHMLRMRRAVIDYREARTPAALWRAAGTSVVATVVLLLAVGVVVWIWRGLDRFLHNRLKARIGSVGIQSFEVMRAERVWSALRGGVFALRTVLFVVIGLLYLTFVLAQLPWTRGLSSDVVSFAIGPLETMGQGLVDFIPSLLFLLVLFLIVRFGLKLVRLFFDAVRHGSVAFDGFDAEWADPTYNLLRVAIVGFALVVAYPYIPGSDTAAFKGISLFAGIVFSLGSSSAISNIIAGYMLTYRRAMKVGDRVRIGDAFGEVLAVRLQVTHMRSFKNEEIIIPNSQILGTEVINYSSLARTRGLILHTEIGIGYETPWRQVEAMLLAAADRTEGLSKEPRPFVLQKKLGDFAVTYEINAFCNEVTRMHLMYTDLHRHILDVFNEYGVQIMTPAYEGDPEIPKVVARKDWHTAPALPPQGSSTS